MIVRRRRNLPAPLLRPLAGVLGPAAALAALLVAPLVVGAVAASLLGYGWRRGLGAGMVFSLVAGTVRGLLGARRVERQGAERKVVDLEPEPEPEPEPE